MSAAGVSAAPAAPFGYDASAEALIKRDAKLDEDNSIWKQKCTRIAEVIRPLRDELLGPKQEGARRDRKVFDGTAIAANQNFAAGMYGAACNPADEWFTFETADPYLNKYGPVQDYLAIVSRRTLASFGPSWSQFYGRVPSLFLDVGAFGQAYMSSLMRPDLSGFNDLCTPLSEGRFDVDENGDANAFFRRWRLPAGSYKRMIEAKAKARGAEPKFSGKFTDQVTKDPFCPVEVLHATVPNEDYMPGFIGPKGFAFASVYCEVESKTENFRSGFEDFPWFVLRWEVAAGERNARGPGEIALADVLSKNVMRRDNLKAGQRAADPPWGAPDEGTISVTRAKPGAVLYGAVNARGEQVLKPLIDGVDAPFSLEMEQALESAIKDAFFFSLMQIVGRTGMTATETLERSEERMRLMGPYQGRIQTDFLCPLVIRRYKMLRKIPGVFPPPPPQLQGRSLQVAFVSPMALAQKSARANRAIRAGQAIAAMAPVDSSIMDGFNADAYRKAVVEGFAVPELSYDDDTTAQNRQARMQQTAMLQAAEAAPKVADAAHSAAQAAQTATTGAAPQGQS